MYWRVKRKAWVTSELFMDWFHNCFVPQVERYLAGKNLSFKVFLLLGNAPGHPMDLNGTHPNVEVMFLPPNTTSLIQPLDQGVILLRIWKPFAHKQTAAPVVQLF